MLEHHIHCAASYLDSE